MGGHAACGGSVAFLELRNLSFALWWTWVWVLFFPGDAQILSQYLPFPWWVTFLAAASASGAVLIAAPPLLRSLATWSQKPRIAVGATLTAISFALYYVKSEPLLFALVAVAGLLSTVWGAWTLGRLAGSGPKTSAGIASSMFVAAVLYLLVIGRPTFVEASLSALLPLASFVFAQIADRAGIEDRRPETPASVGGEKASASNATPEGPVSSLQPSSGWVANSVVAFLCTSAFGFFGSYIAQDASLEMAPVVIITIVAVSLPLWYMLGLDSSRILGIGQYASSVPLYVLGLVALIAAIALGKGFIPIAVVLVVAGWVFGIVFGWSSLMTLGGVPASPVLCILVVQAGTLAGSALVPLAGTIGLSGTLELVVPIILVVMLVLLLSALMLRSQSSAYRPAPPADADGRPGAGPQSPELAKLAACYGLSEREAEVCGRLLSGHSLQTIADEMVVSKSTVSTHAQHIYRKCGVHDRTGLAELLEDKDA